MRSSLVKTVVVTCFLCSFLPVIPACGESESARVQREVDQWTAFRERAQKYVKEAFVIKRKDGICILYSEQMLGVGLLSYMINAPCPEGETH